MNASAAFWITPPGVLCAALSRTCYHDPNDTYLPQGGIPNYDTF